MLTKVEILKKTLENMRKTLDEKPIQGRYKEFNELASKLEILNSVNEFGLESVIHFLKIEIEKL